MIRLLAGGYWGVSYSSLSRLCKWRLSPSAGYHNITLVNLVLWFLHSILWSNRNVGTFEFMHSWTLWPCLRKSQLWATRGREIERETETEKDYSSTFHWRQNTILCEVCLRCRRPYCCTIVQMAQNESLNQACVILHREITLWSWETTWFHDQKTMPLE